MSKNPFVYFLLAIPIYLALFFVMNTIVRPIVGNKFMNRYLGGSKGEYFGPDGPANFGLFWISVVIFIVIIIVLSQIL